MKVLLQRVNKSILTSDNFRSEIGHGLLVTVGVSNNDTFYDIKYLAKKIVGLRVFKDENDKMNLSVLDVNGDIMVVSNFTLQGNATRGTRPDFSRAGKSEFALDCYLKLIDEIKAYNVKKVEMGNFGHHMDINAEIVGPFNLIIESEGREHE